MDTTKLVVGQKVKLFGCGFFEGTVVRTIPPATEPPLPTNRLLAGGGVEVESFGLLAQFDKEGKETEDSRHRRAGGSSSWGPEWQAWELKSAVERRTNDE